jgi:NAD(P)H dehydrogenase (quinone)
MASILITYYSRSGNTAQMAEQVAEGARQIAGVQVDVKPCGEVSPDDLLQHNGIIMGSPVYYGTMAAELKTLIDESVGHHTKLEGKVGGAFASAGVFGGGVETTVVDILRALMIHGMVVKGDPRGNHYGPVAIGAPDDKARDECRRWGRTLAELTKKLHG